MKVHVSYQMAHEAIDKFRFNKELSDVEKDCLLDVLNAAEGDLIPDRIELQQQEQNVKLLDNLNPDSESWDRVMENIRVFENKYC